MLYAIFTTIFINNFSLRRFKVPRKTVDIVLDRELMEKNVPYNYNEGFDLTNIGSPRRQTNGDVVYLSSDNVSWVYAVDSGSYIEEMSFLRSYGLRHEKDYAEFNSRQAAESLFIRSCDSWGRGSKISWLRVVGRRKGLIELEVNQEELNNGMHIRVIKR